MVSLPSSVSANPSLNVRTILAYINHYESWHTYESAEQRLAAHSALLAPTMEYQVLPRSFGQPPLKKQECIESTDHFMAILPEFKIMIHELIESGDSVVLHASSQGRSTTGATYSNEYMFIFHLVESETGPDALPQISLLKEFLDTEYTKAFFQGESGRSAALLAAASK